MAEVPPANTNNDKNQFATKPPDFDGERFDYWKDIIKSFFLDFDVDTCDMVTNGYTRPINSNGVKLKRSATNKQ